MQGLGSSERDEQLLALRAIKNQIIGNKRRKLVLLPAVPRVVQLLRSSRDPELLVQCAAAIGSFSYGTDDGARAVVESDGVAALAGHLGSADERVVEAAARSLKLVYQSSLAPHDPLLAAPALPKLVQLLSSSRPPVAEVAACVVSRCCTSADEQHAVASAGAVAALLPLLQSTRLNSQEAAMEALAALTSSNRAACRQLLAAPHALDAVLALLRTRSPRLAYLGASLIANLCRDAGCDDLPPPAPPQATADGGGAAAPPAGEAGAPAPAADAGGDGAAAAAMGAAAAKLSAARRSVLPGLVRLLADGSVRERVPGVLARLAGSNGELLKSVLDAGGVASLAKCLGEPGGSATLRAGALQALGSLCLHLEAARQQVVDAKLMPAVLAGLSDPDEAVRAAAALCVRALSRGVRQLRCGAVDSGVAAPLCRLLADNSYEVQLNAAAAMCNLVLEFSSVRSALLQAGVLRALVPLAGSMLPELRLNAVWALKNLVHEADAGTLAELPGQLPWAALRALLSDDEASVREQAMCLMQNLCKGGDECVKQLLAWSNGDLLPLLERHLDPAGTHQLPPALLQRALYAAANLCGGGETAKAAVMDSRLPQLLAELMGPPAPPEAWLPAVWCVINLLWGEEGDAGGDSAERGASSPAGAGGAGGAPAVVGGSGRDSAAARAARLRQLGLEGQLRALLELPAAGQDVRERSQTALEQLLAK